MLTIEHKPGLPTLPDPKGRAPEKHNGLSGQPIPDASLVGLKPDGEFNKDGATTDTTAPKQIASAPKQIDLPAKPRRHGKSARGVFVCSKCGAPFEREKRRGRPWSKCPKCR